MLKLVVLLLVAIASLDGQMFLAPMCVPGIQYYRDLRAKAQDGDHDVMGVSQVFNSSSFYVLTQSHLDFDKSLRICKNNNGYLAEINTVDEYQFINETLTTLLEKRREVFWVQLGAKYESTVDGYILQGYTHPEDVIYDGHWYRGEPDQHSPDTNWLHLFRASDEDTWMLNDEKKDIRWRHEVSLCEVSANYMFS